MHILSFISKTFPGGPIKFQEISRSSGSFRHPGVSAVSKKELAMKYNTEWQQMIKEN